MELIDYIFVSSIISLIIITLFSIVPINHQIIIFLIVLMANNPVFNLSLVYAKAIFFHLL